MLRVAAALLVLVLLASAANGTGLTSLQFTAASQPAPGGKVRAEIVAGGARILSLTGGAQVQAQVTRAAALLTEAAIRGTPPDQIVVRGEGPTRTLAVGDTLLITITKQTAFAAGSTLEGLAATWQSHIRQAFCRPYISLPVERAIIPVGETRRLVLRGNLPTPPQIGVQPAGLAAAVLEATALQVALTGLAPGTATLTITCGPAILSLPLQVMKYAGRLLSAPAAQVTGSTIPPWVITRAARAAAALALAPEPGATVAWGETLVPPAALRVGGSCTAAVEVSITGPDYLPVTTRVPIRVDSLPLPPRDAAVLMVSNNPERLRSHGLWYEAQLEPARPTRFLYHHVNSTGALAELLVEVANLSTVPAKLWVIESAAGPSSDEIWVGHVATATYLERQRQGLGYLVAIPPGTRYLIQRQPVPHGQVVSGVDDFTLLEGEGLSLRLLLAPPGSNYLYAGLDGYRRSQVGEQFVFPNPNKSLEASYTVGGNWAFVTVGRHAIAGGRDGELLRGNYGVYYDIKFNLNNPTDRTAQVELGVQSAGGACRAVLIADGRKYETGFIAPRGEQVVASFTLRPHSTRTLPVRIMPQAGSNYPIWVLVRQAGYRG